MSRSKRWDRSEEFLTAWQFAELLNVCEESVYRAHQRGQIQAVRIGRSIRFPTSQLICRHGGEEGEPEKSQRD